jgi:cell division protein FtsL
MNRVQSLTQAYSQAPWRKQLQWIGLFLLILILIALVAGIYLSVSARAASIGRQIQSTYAEMERITRNIEDLQTQLANLTSSTVMQKRAEELGFLPVTSDQILYVPVPGYIRPAQVTLGGTPGRILPSTPQISAEFTESLFDWLRERVFEPAAPLLQEVNP